MSFFGIFVPLMVYAVLVMFKNLLKFVQLMQIEDCEDSNAILSPKQIKYLMKIARNLLFYFGMYYLVQ